MKKNRQSKNHRKMWQFMRKKELDDFLNPKPQPQSTGLLRHQNAINAFFKELSAQAPHDTAQENAHPDTNLSAILQMADITADVIAPLFTEMPNYLTETYNVF